jgi:hypothetical protein
MRYLKSFLLFWYDFIIGDDWTVALGVILALGITRVVAHQGVTSWWLMPIAVTILLGASLWRAAGGRRLRAEDEQSP